MAPNPWNVTFQTDGITATIDVPGCKAEGIELELTNGKLNVKATRAKAVASDATSNPPTKRTTKKSVTKQVPTTSAPRRPVTAR